ncbi:M48 family metalloprotease [Sphingomonas sp. PR090111-T3T-6A]|uniref:M48 family metalloprotease n=1 Tax=Sphingomonas sp. PR090111-T3T-6A TaxID=685778 RepID=UPI00035D1388|nr:M48 family metalloprotease [Sphingomonas sp. PR090111-T3T-6A]
MASFDPEIATATYMASLTAAQHAKASAYTHGGEWLLLWGWLVGVAVAWLIARTGVLVRVRDRVRRPNLAVIACVTTFVLLAWAIGLPWSIYADWWRERGYGLTTQPFMGWLGENALSCVIGAILEALLALAIYALMRRTPRWWWAWSGGVAVVGIVIAIVISPVMIEPLFNTYTPAPAGPTRDAIVALAHRAGVPSDKILIYNGSKQSQRYTANVSGLFGTARVAMSDTMFQQGADLSEVRAVVGHEMGHYRRGHVFFSALVLGLLAIVMFFIADRAFPMVRHWMGVEGVKAIADPAGLPVLMVIAGTLGLLATPIVNTLSRFEESDADRFSLEYAQEPDGLAKALVKTIEYRASSPAPVEEMIFYDHPSVERRVHRAMVWKAEHRGHVGG